MGISLINIAKNLAHVAKNIQIHVKSAFKEGSQGPLLQKLFKQFLEFIPDLDVDKYADNFAQILVYALICIEASPQKEVVRETLLILNPFFKLLFENFLLSDEAEAYGIDEINQMFQKSDIRKIFQTSNKIENEEDPIITFYEHFLMYYAPKQKIQRGVFYTPIPIVSFINKSVDYLLRTQFNLSDGLTAICKPSDKEIPLIQIIDPAAGSGTFLLEIIEEIKREWDQKLSNKGLQARQREWSKAVSEYLLPRLVGVELLIPPYLVACLKLILKFMETGYQFNSTDHLRFHHGNSLELIKTDEFSPQQPGPYVNIIIGNPPYQTNPKNTTPFIQNLMESYKTAVKNEKYIKPLSDDYIKFLRLAHHLIEKAESGIIGMVTNHGFLSGLIHRGMRQELFDYFDQLFFLDLHGNINIGEASPDGSKDENVFDIQQGVVIIFLVKLPVASTRSKVFHFELWGKQAQKYHFLLNNDVSTINWKQIKPIPPNYFFLPIDTTLEDEYKSYPSLTELFQLYRIGILTNRDWLTIDYTIDALKEKIERFFSLLNQPELIDEFPLLADSWWDYSKLQEVKINEVYDSITPCLFRPFDIRYITYHSSLLNRARKEIMDHINGRDNIVLISSRHYRKKIFTSCFISNYIVEQKAGESTRGSYVFPLYIYSPDGKIFNFTPLAKKFFKKTIPEFSENTVIGYIYAILHSPTYRQRYQVYLKLDFPRIPLTTDLSLFSQLATLGQDLIKFHLLKQTSQPDITFEGAGNNIIENGYPKFKDSSIYINSSQSFKFISSEAWNFSIGGYRVCQKWLKDRKGRNLEFQDISHYQKIVQSIIQTIKLMNTIDNVIKNQGGWPLK